MSTFAMAGLDSLSEGSMYSQSTDSGGACSESEMSRLVCFCASFPVVPAKHGPLLWMGSISCMHGDNTAFISVCCPHVSGYKMHCAHIWSAFHTEKHSRHSKTSYSELGKNTVIHDQHIWNVFGLVIILNNYTFPFFTFTFSQLHTYSQNRDLKCRRKP